jgi:hypothetical protein
MFIGPSKSKQGEWEANDDEESTSCCVCARELHKYLLIMEEKGGMGVTLPFQHISRAGHSGGTEPIGSVSRFLQNFGSYIICTDRLFLEAGTDQLRFRVVRFGSGTCRRNRSFKMHKNSSFNSKF